MPFVSWDSVCLSFWRTQVQFLMGEENFTQRQHFKDFHYLTNSAMACSKALTKQHAEAGLHSDDKVVEAKEVNVEHHEEHCDEGEEAEQEGHQEATQVIPALAHGGREQPCTQCLFVEVRDGIVQIIQVISEMLS